MLETMVHWIYCHWYCPFWNHYLHHQTPHIHPSKTARNRDQTKNHIWTRRNPSNQLLVWHKFDITARALSSNWNQRIVGDNVIWKPRMPESRHPPSLNYLPVSSCPFPNNGPTCGFQDTPIKLWPLHWLAHEEAEIVLPWVLEVSLTTLRRTVWGGQ